MNSMVPLAALAATMGFAPTAAFPTAQVNDGNSPLPTVLSTAQVRDGNSLPPAVSSTAQVFDRDSRLLAEGRFDAGAGSFAVTKWIDDNGRAYLEYRYTRADGLPRTGTHWAGREAGETARFAHDFTEGRRITFRVCVTGDHDFNACSAGDDGENWTLAIA